MAQSAADSNIHDIKIVEAEEENNLKYLDFVHTRALQLAGCLSTVYDYAKHNSGPLKPRVESLEGAVKTAVSPYHSVPLDLLKYVDHKVDVSVAAAQKAPEAARSVRREGLVGTAKGVAKKVEPAAVTAWRKVNSLPLVPRVAEAVVPRVGYCGEKYNEAVGYAVEKGYGVGAYLPLVPTKRIAEVFGKGEERGRVLAVEE